MRGRRRGFTLVELGVVVIITTILATVAYMGFRRHRATMRMAEATDLTHTIMDAQEAYQAETGVYANISNDNLSFYPAATPGEFKTAWGGPCTNCVSSDAWTTLTVIPHGAVMYGYATTAGIGGVPTSPSPGPGPMSPMASLAPSSSSGSSGSPSTATDPYYVVAARGDTDGDGVFCDIVASSTGHSFIVTNEGE
jgi:prepilin-type N-terminal cleavage/methylation domain-containing protein